ncbi:MAG: precorrin-3B synthase [Methylocella sp.]
MLTREQLRRGRCPGALSPMQAQDGLLVRLRISGGTVAASTMRRLAEAGREYGNGLFDLSSRGNLQLRGLTDKTLPSLIGTLADLGLIDDEPAAEAVRNVLTSPLAGFGAAIDVAPIGNALEAALVRARDLHDLPGKFCFLIDDGGPFSLALIPADVRFLLRPNCDDFIVSIGGDASDAIDLGACDSGMIVDIALRLARTFRDLSASMSEPPRRMRELVSRCGPLAIANATGLSLAPAGRRKVQDELSAVGLLDIGAGISGFGAGAAFGRLTATMLDAAADAAEIFGLGEIRLTPWRALIAPHIDARRCEALRQHFAAAGFIIDSEDPRLAVAACGGAPACARGTTDSHSDALALASIARRLQRSGVALHVSGCCKGCAKPSATPYTLVANAGLYDLAFNATTHDPSLTQGLTLAAARDMLGAAAGRAEDNAKRDIS